ncbi:MAG: nucleotidyltransferase substrate binding protein [Magnetococcales bacterium]|nr:nucleotidyltransferase substrate binding protein [Magnetococcales bacterium]
MNPDIRWRHRFRNFDRAFLLLREIQERDLEQLSQLEKEGAVQRFERAFELAWKTLKDFLEENGLVIAPVTPRQVIKEAFAARMLDDAQIWIDMMLHRNLLSHTYDHKVFDTLLQTLNTRYFPAFDRLHTFFMNTILENE